MIASTTAMSRSPVTNRARWLATLVALATAALASTSPVPAISFSGDRASGCITVGPGDTHVLNFVSGTSAGTTLVLFGMISNGAAAGTTPVADSRANAWALAHTFTAANGSRLFIYEARVAAGKSHSPGDSLTITYNGANTNKSCVVLSNFVGIAAPSSLDRANGASATSTSPAVSTNGSTTQADELMVGAFGFVQATGGFGPSAPAQSVSPTCDAPHCLFPVYRILGTTGSYSLAGATNNSVAWGAIGVTLRADNTIFIDGFENTTTANWSSVQ